MKTNTKTNTKESKVNDVKKVERKVFTYNSFESETVGTGKETKLIYKLICGKKILKLYSKESYKEIYDLRLKETNTISCEVVDADKNVITIKNIRYLKKAI